MNSVTLLEKFYTPGQLCHLLLLRHSQLVAEKAEAIARRLPQEVDVSFVREAALLHDIGIVHTAAPELGCFGELPYLCHGYKGREMLEAEGLPRHALVCERHIGVGLTAEEIRRQKLPLPERDMLPLCIEEQIVAYADLFYSKNPERSELKRSVGEVRESLLRFGPEKAAIFDLWHARFGGQGG